ncbi:MAG TPA: hypothetical protein DEB17_01920 [Chlorobaculum sp.]|uniref:Uncharacterized protein n=1 Tax=Chlorobaculum tepidum (strain ATCC 49652 / DSM 12025 / NBRC 103806 / TLS) TaxID=194439 RepID=Q8KDJ3_CHLTE|nr:hypothetical protein CT1057 [Chlorobaculum tepidum TLS]HBU22756.1 hypothetical protein [Chlorobaculum sp.]
MRKSSQDWSIRALAMAQSVNAEQSVLKALFDKTKKRQYRMPEKRRLVITDELICRRN